MEVSVKSRPWIKAQVAGDVDAINSARLAFLTHTGSPDEADWKTAEFVDAGTDPQGRPVVDVRILVGPGAEVLAPGRYVMWVELDAPPELIREPAPGDVRITP